MITWRVTWLGAGALYEAIFVGDISNIYNYPPEWLPESKRHCPPNNHNIISIVRVPQ